MQEATRRRRPRARGFTLVELLAVVAMVGILAALAMIGYRKYMTSAGTAEAHAVIQGIRAGEEAYKAEMLVYLGCSGCNNPQGCPPGGGSLEAYYPMASPGKPKHSWIHSAHPDFECWRRLNVSTDSEVRFGYAVVAGMPGGITAVPSPQFTAPPVWPAGALVLEPWYVVQARGDRDEDGSPALFIASSLKGEVYVEGETE